MILDENLFEDYLTEEEQREEDELIAKYLSSIPTIGHIDSKTGRVVYTEKDLRYLNE